MKGKWKLSFLFQKPSCFANRKLLILEHRKMAVPTFWKHVFVERGMLSLAGPDLAVP
jgi:hypothetical protein